MKEVKDGVMEDLTNYYETLPGERIFLGIVDMKIWNKNQVY